MNSGRQKRFCFVTISNAFGGMERHTSALARLLSERGHHVDVVQLRHDQYRREFAAGREIGVHTINVDPNPDLRQLRALRRALRPWRDALGIFPKGWFAHGGVAFDFVARGCFRRLVTIEHLQAPPLPKPARSRTVHFGLVPGLGLWWYRKRFLGWLRGRASHHVVCVSEAVRQALIETYGFAPAKLTTIRNGIDTETFTHRERDRVGVREALAIPRDARVFGFVGRFTVQKNLPAALRAFSAATGTARRDCRFILAGDGELRPELERTVRTLDIESKVHFHDFTNRPEMLYSAMDVLLLPSLNEGLPLALLEAMACHCVPIATSVGGVPEVLTDRRFGWLVAPNDAQALSSAVRAAADVSDEELRQMGTMAREHVRTRFNARSQFAALADLLEEEHQLGTPLWAPGRLAGQRARQSVPSCGSR